MTAPRTDSQPHPETDDLASRLEALSRATPKKPNLVIFAGRVSGRFLDNVKYLFAHCVAQSKKLTCFFLTHDPSEYKTLSALGLPTLLFPQDESLQLLARASVVVSDDFWWKTHSPAYPLLKDCKTLQLWHGVPLKKIGFPEIESGINMTPDKAAHLEFGYSGYDGVVSTSPWATRETFGKVFRAAAFHETGYPRNDVLLRVPGSLTKIDMVNVDVQLYGTLKGLRKQGRRTIFFMPTFRDTGGDPFSDKALDLAAMSRFAAENNAEWVLKFHPYLTVTVPPGIPHVHGCQAQSDPYPLLAQCDVLCTDYSSIYIDYMLLDRPLVFFPYDFDKYVSQDRELFFDFHAFAPGPDCRDQESLFRALADALAGDDPRREDRNALCDTLFTHRDDKACERLRLILESEYTS